MIKKLLPIVYFILMIAGSLNACTFFPNPFCEAPLANPDDLVVSGQIVGIDDDGIDLKVIQVFKGVENKDTIRIWDGTDFDCNGTFSMAASLLGNLEDSILIILPVIDSLENSWDVIGDYRRPDFVSFFSTLPIQNNTITGFISHVVTADTNYYVSSYPYDAFATTWGTLGDCSDIMADTKDLQPEKIDVTINNPVTSFARLVFSGQEFSTKQLEIFSMRGIHLKSILTEQKIIEIDFSNYPTGMYFIRIMDDKKRRHVIKIIKI